MELEAALKFNYSSVAQRIVCSADALSEIRGSLDRIGVEKAMIVCGPSVLRDSDVIQRVQSSLGELCVGVFSGGWPLMSRLRPSRKRLEWPRTSVQTLW